MRSFYCLLATIKDKNNSGLSCAKLKSSLVRVVTEDEIEVIVGVHYLSGCVGWWTGLNENNAKSALTKVEVKV